MVIGDKYLLLNELASGGMGAIWRAEHLVLRAPVAIKWLLPSAVGNADARQRFWREASVTAALRSAHIVQVVDYGLWHAVPYFVMELLEGESLAARLNRVGSLEPEHTSNILRHLARALGRAHELGVVHRDLKPQNVFLVEDGNRELTKLLDFGVAKVNTGGFEIELSRNTQRRDLVGTLQYMSPEQLNDADSVTPQSDVWALGAVAFECLLGFPLFPCRDLRSLVQDICINPLPVPSKLGRVSPAFDAWFRRACARDLEKRFATARQAAAEFDCLCRAAGSNEERSRRHVVTPSVHRARVPAGSAQEARTVRVGTGWRSALVVCALAATAAVSWICANYGGFQ